MKKRFKFFRLADKSDGWITFSTIFLAGFGLVMAVSASMTVTDNSSKILILATIKQFAYFIISYTGMVFASKQFSYKRIRPFIMSVSIFIIALLLYALTFDKVFGARAWIRLPLGFMEFSLQPSEFAKVTMILLIALYVGDVSLNTKRSGYEILKHVIIIFAIQVVIVLFFQSDLGSAVVLFIVGVVALLIPNHPKIRKIQNVVLLVIIIGFGATVFLLTDSGLDLVAKSRLFEPYQLARFRDYANPFVNFMGTGYQLAGSLVAFSRGSMIGVGLGQSIQKYGYLPAVRTDFILALIAEELGFLGVMVLMFVYGLLIWRLTFYAVKVKSEKDKIILTGTIVYLFVHLLFNVGGITATIPLTGLPLLLISAGGSSTMSIMLAIGISQNVISRYRKTEARRQS